jgi:hypothetical protein
MTANFNGIKTLSRNLDLKSNGIKTITKKREGGYALY